MQKQQHERCRLCEDSISERHIQALWYDERLRPVDLRSTHGAEINVIDPGRWNLEAGPDFRDAVLEIGFFRTRLCGDVEVHLRPSDWQAHGHGGDVAYRNVIAHVTWYSGPDGSEGKMGLPRGCVRICLGEHLRCRMDFSLEEIDLQAYPYAHLPVSPRPCESFLAHDPDLALEMMWAAGRRRLELKARRLKALFVRRQDRNQVFYEEVLAALGYKQNSDAFRRLGQNLPWYELPSDPEMAYHVLSCAAELGVAQSNPWRRANVRPANAPERRFRAVAALFAGQSPERLFGFDAHDLSSREGQQAALAHLGRSHFIGMRRAAAILANVLVPFARAEERLSAVPEWLFPEELSSPVRLMANRLLGRDHNPALYAGNGLFVQGLLQIYRDYCLQSHEGCTGCTLVEALRGHEEEDSERKE